MLQLSYRPYRTFFAVLLAVGSLTGLLRAQSSNPCNFSVTLRKPPVACNQLTFTPEALAYTLRGNYDEVCWIFASGATVDTICGEDFGTYTFDQSGTITLQAASSCKTLKKRVSVTIEQQADLRLTASDPYCSGSDPVMLTASIPGGLWSGDGITDPTRGVFDPGAVSSGSARVRYTVVSGVCPYSETLALTVVQSEELSAQDTVVCEQAAAFSIQVSQTGGSWSGSGIVESTGLFDPASVRPGTYRPTYGYRSPQGCTIIAQPTVVVQRLPRVTAPDTVRVCSVDRALNLLDLTGVSYSPRAGSLHWSVDGRANPSGILNPVADLPGSGVYPVSLTYTLGNCTRTVSMVLLLEDQPDVQLTVPEPQCLSTAHYTLQASIPGGVWSGPAVDATTGTVDLRRAKAGTYDYTYRYQEETTCEQRATVSLTIIASPEGLTAGPDRTVCQGTADVIKLEGASPGGGTFTGPALQGRTVDLNQLTPGTSYTYTYTVGQSGACREQATRTIHYAPRPSADFDLPDSVCVGTTIPITTAGSPGTYHYDFGNGEQSDLTDPTITYQRGNRTYLVTQTVRSTEGCTDTSQQSVRVVNPPRAGFALDSLEGCSPFLLSLDDRSTYATQVTYRIGHNAQIGSTTGYLLPPSRRDTQWVVVQEVSNLCGAANSQQTVHVTAPPRANFAPDRSIGCGPFSPQLTNTSLGSGSRYRWDYGNGIITVGQQAEVPTYYNPTDSTAFFDIELVAANACGADTVRRQLQVLPSDIRAAIVLNDRQGCTPFTPSLQSGATPDAPLRWSLLDATGRQLAVSSDDTPNFTLDVVGRYAVVLQVSGCGTDADTVYVEALPAPDLSILAPQRICATAPLVLRASGDTTNALRWTFPDGTASTLSTPAYRFTQPGESVVHLVARPTEAGGCMAVDSAVIEVLPAPVVTPVVVDSLGCTPFIARFSLDDSIPADLTYQWTFGDSSAPSSLPAPVHEYTTAGRYRPVLTVWDADGCTTTTAVPDVTVDTPPVADFDAIVDLDPTVLGDVQFRNYSSDAAQFLWTFGDSSSTTEVAPLYIYPDDRAYTVTLTASNMYPGGTTCSDTLTLPVRPESFGRFFVPTAVSPDNGVAEVRQWGAKGLGVAAYQLQVYSPAGQRVFLTDELTGTTPTGRWDGMDARSQSPVPQGSYTWRATVTYTDGRRDNLLGTVTVIR
ncbi:hypothetical protein LEM8419_02950 [Neolewinella maritima]|uniref:PKD domain-containing protein n=1 Tax=Neolewinella maritima TaxID=1383882 RepID=A0ABN8FCF8_9BACT|nr:PKD domain-containing protein [Neolewinella maritima]CAH1002035.1 hypothetical protein LEM8419_02950 [Neolewinella maritima]